MWPLSSQNINDLNRNSKKNEHNNNINEQGPIYQTPFKQSLNIERNNDTPLQIDFNFYFGNLWSSEHIPSQHFEIPINKSVTKNSSETNLLLFKSSLEKSGYKLSSISEIKSSNIVDKALHENNNNIYDNLNQNKFTKKNLNELFDNVKNDEFLNSNKKDNNIKNNSFEKNNIYYCDIKYNNINNIFIPNNCINNNLIFNHNSNNNLQNNEFDDDKENNNYNFVDEQNIFNRNNENENKNKINNSEFNNMNINEKKEEEIFSSPIKKKPKKIFECSGSTLATNSSKSSIKKRRFRKNNDQIAMLLQFFNENKHWSRNQIKEISQKTGLKENKVYKWLWDQRNKEYKSTKFVINKKDLP